MWVFRLCVGEHLLGRLDTVALAPDQCAQRSEVIAGAATHIEHTTTAREPGRLDEALHVARMDSAVLSVIGSELIVGNGF